MLLQTTLVFQREDEEEEKEGKGMQTIKFSCLLDDPCRKKDVLLWVLLQGTTGPISIVPKRFGSSNRHASSPSTHNIHTHNCQLMTQLQIQLPLSLLSVNPLCFLFLHAQHKWKTGSLNYLTCLTLPMSRRQAH